MSGLRRKIQWEYSQIVLDDLDFLDLKIIICAKLGGVFGIMLNVLCNVGKSRKE